MLHRMLIAVAASAKVALKLCLKQMGQVEVKSPWIFSLAYSSLRGGPVSRSYSAELAEGHALCGPLGIDRHHAFADNSLQLFK